MLEKPSRASSLSTSALVIPVRSTTLAVTIRCRWAKRVLILSFPFKRAALASFGTIPCRDVSQGSRLPLQQGMDKGLMSGIRQGLSGVWMITHYCTS